jgi:hypothetical protein
MTVDTRTLRMNDHATITVVVEGSFAANDYVDIPLDNLAFVGEPYVASEFAWINGQVMRRKVFRYRVRPVAPGVGRVGPLELTAEDGQFERVNAIELQVLPDRAAGSNDPAAVLRELLAAGREPFFVVAEVEQPSVFVGEPVVVTWVMYNAAIVQSWQVVTIPKLADFWSEELTRNEDPERVYLDDVMVQRLPIRRVALFPLRSGRLRVEGMTVEGAVMRPSRRGPFSIFEGDLVEASFTSAPIDIDVRPFPAGAPVDVVGDLSLTCDPPVQRGTGPVVIRVELSGAGNVRAAVAPRFAGAVDGTVQFEGGQVTVQRDPARLEMTRRWQILIFPARPGPLEIPPLVTTTFVPAAGIRRELRCASAILDVVAAKAPEVAAARPLPAAAPRRVPGRWIFAFAAIGLALLVILPRAWRELAIRREARELVHGASAAEIRMRLEQRVSFDLREASDRGDAWRALRSLLDAAERERDIAAGAGEEIVQRIRELLRIIRR